MQDVKIADISGTKEGISEAKIGELETNSKIKNRDLYRGISDFKKGYQPRTNVVKDEKGDLFADPHSILARQWKYFSQLRNIHGVNNVRPTDIRTTEPLVPEPSDFEFQLATEKLKTHKSPDSDQIPAELFKAWSRKIRHQIHKLIISIWNKERKESIILPIYEFKKDDKIHCGNYRGNNVANYVQYFIQHPAVKVNSICRGNYWVLSMWISTQQVNY